MNKVNKIFKNTITDKLNFKNRYVITSMDKTIFKNVVLNIKFPKYNLYVIEYKNKSLKYYGGDNVLEYFYIFNPKNTPFDFFKGSIFSFKNGEYHSYKDLPSIKTKDYTYWHKNNKAHRDGDKPAVIHKNGIQEWWINGNRHRDDDKFGNPQPAIIHSNGKKRYYKNGTQFYP